jgi:endonuclease/exonuclease/phosphatase family metal-dependent hydrolase
MTTWRVLTWNILGRARPNIDDLAAVISNLAPDVVAVQEIQKRQADVLAGALRWRALWTRKHYPYTPLIWWRAEGLAMLTPHGLGDTVTASISPGVSTWTYRRRVAMAATIRRGDDALRVANTHLASHSADERVAQARRTAALVGGTRPAVVAGDLNAANEPEVVREFTALGMVDPGGDFSSPAMAPVQRIDYILVPERGTVTVRQTPEGGEHWNELSDHLPVLIEFSV